MAFFCYNVLNMASWSNRRKFMYGGSLIAIVVIIVGYVIFSLLYVAPTCSDGLQNGDELGVDCGGSCQKLCASAFKSPSVSWTTFENIAPGLYNVASYIINPNAEGEALNVPYHVVIYDNKGVKIQDVASTLHIPPRRDTLAFLGPVSVGKRIPYRVAFEFTASPDWFKSSDTLAPLVISDKKYSEDDSGSSLLVTLTNSSVRTLRKMFVYVVLYDTDGNVIGFSKTTVDPLPGQTSTVAPFTWPVNRQGKVIRIEVYPVAE